ncbi:hypothetical protein ABTX61_09290 [Amycolatopsis japonica]|uniref:hypothetical protein n=1 Tax=Amycolatopsis japonica TaxID=208439 RepID=UPI0033297FAD
MSKRIARRIAAAGIAGALAVGLSLASTTTAEAAAKPGVIKFCGSKTRAVDGAVYVTKAAGNMPYVGYIGAGANQCTTNRKFDNYFLDKNTINVYIIFSTNTSDGKVYTAAVYRKGDRGFVQLVDDPSLHFVKKWVTKRDGDAPTKPIGK